MVRFHVLRRRLFGTIHVIQVTSVNWGEELQNLEGNLVFIVSKDFIGLKCRRVALSDEQKGRKNLAGSRLKEALE